MILITGFPYVRESFFATFRHYPKPNDLIFLLPTLWKVKGGKVIYRPPSDSRIQTTRTFFHHSHYPLIGGSLKGWMPALPLYLWWYRRSLRLVYSCSEPVLLSTLWNSLWVKLFGLKHIVASWENTLFEKKFTGLDKFLHTIILRLNLWFSSGLVAGNQMGAEIYRRLTTHPVEVIPLNGVDPSFFQPDGKGDRNFQGHDFSSHLVFTFAGAIGKRKGIHIALKAFRELVREFPHARFVIAGSGEYEHEIDDVIVALNLQDAIVRFPWLNHDELRELLRASDVFLYPSISYGGWEEQFGYSIAEASLMELPVISTRTGSIPDVVLDEETGILVEGGDSDALLNAMRRLANDEKLRDRLGAQGRVSMTERFSNAIIARRFANFFQQCLR